ncbi:MAG TPA: nitroreductase family protein [Caulobacteraceae bacterium]|nr:nitroreductase family protein [Caulobacteraceae bacterium]
MTNTVLSALEHRRTTNKYDSARDIGDAQISGLVRLATRAPTAFHLQNWRFIAVRTPEGKARLRTLAFDQPKVTDAAVTFIVVGQLASHLVMAERLASSVAAGFMPADVVTGWEGAGKALYFEQPQRQRDEAVRTATFGASQLMFAAQAQGLGSSPMIGFDAAGVAREFGLGSDEVPVVLVTVGYAADGNWPQKPRRPVTELLSFV